VPKSKELRRHSSGNCVNGTWTLSEWLCLWILDRLTKINSYCKVKLNDFFLNTKYPLPYYLEALFPSHTFDNVPLSLRGVDRFHVFKVTVKDQNWF